MVYEWDEKRARRANLTRVGLSLMVGLVAVAIPTCIAFVWKIV